MAQVTYIEHNGAIHEVDVNDGDTVMQGAINNMINGIIGECGGGLSCATCHCIVDEAWLDRLDPPSEAEQEMLEFAAEEASPGSRLSCQVVVNGELDGLVVRLPKSQF
jgi:ferredoxin, 2Fe-2S